MAEFEQVVVMTVCGGLQDLEISLNSGCMFSSVPKPTG